MENKLDKEFVNYAQALAVKELGFEEKCSAYYYEMLFYYRIRFHHPCTMPNSPESCLAPLKQQVFRFFREKYRFESSIIAMALPYEKYKEYQFVITHIESESVETNFNTYEEAENACIDKLIEIAKQQVIP
jgi:hypothetical protein